MNSKLFISQVAHERFHPASHRLQYHLYVYAFDLAELEALDHSLRLFGYNRPRPVSLHDSDYLDPSAGSIRDKLNRRLSQYMPADSVNRVVMVTSPRLLGHVFNPVSFYYCFDDRGRLAAAVAEVNNTFGEKHIYVLPNAMPGASDFPARFQARKDFHVSPFNNMEGTYDFRFGDIRQELDIRIDLHRGRKHVLRAHLTGTPLALTPMSQLKLLLRHPVMPHLTMPRIYKEALLLRFKRNLDFYSKPVPHSPMTIRRLPPTPLQRYGMKLILRHLSKADAGHLQLTLPDGARFDFGGEKGRGTARMQVQDYRFFSRVVLGSEIGLGEAFVFDEWDTDDIPAVLGFFIRNRPTLQDGNFTESLVSQALEKMRYLTRRNTLPGSRRNIRRHYDLSNAFFQTFLDDSMAYSCALFSHPGQSLEVAQQNKYRSIIEKARLSPEDHVLEIGCGWGGFAIEAVRRRGCRVTGITLSRDQFRLARERVREAGLQDRIDIRFEDYRSIRGRFDKIVSIEMLEAVGHAYFGAFFRQLDRLMAPDGIAVLQVITIPDWRYNTYRRSHDWIRKHIFPGGLLPSLTVLTRNMTRRSTLLVDHLENIGDHYALTLAEWRRRFAANRNRVAGLGFDRAFRRKWVYYLGICEAGFREHVLGDLQLVLTREGNLNLSKHKFDDDLSTPSCET